MSWESFLTRLRQDYGDVEQEVSGSDKLILVSPGENPPEVILGVEELADSEGVDLFFSNFKEDGRLEFMLRNLGFAGDVFDKYGSELNSEGPEDPLEYLKKFATFESPAEVEGDSGIWVSPSKKIEGGILVLIVDSAPEDKYGRLVVVPDDSGWKLQELVRSGEEDPTFYLPVEWVEGVVIPYDEFEAWLYAKHFEMKNLGEDVPSVEKFGFLGQQFVPEGQDPNDYQRYLGPGQDFPEDETGPLLDIGDDRE